MCLKLRLESGSYLTSWGILPDFAGDVTCPGGGSILTSWGSTCLLGGRSGSCPYQAFRSAFWLLCHTIRRTIATRQNHRRNAGFLQQNYPDLLGAYRRV